MPFFSDAERSSLSINQMIFHIVGPLDEPILLEKLTLSDELNTFFIDRILSGNSGNRYEFKPTSSTERALNQIAADPEVFSDRSKELAVDFHKHHRRSASPGAFLVFSITWNTKAPLFALLKYDDDQAIEYDYAAKNGRNEATLRFLQRTFVKKPEAMQKLAIVKLRPAGTPGELAIRDRGHHDGISEYFEKFLDVRRVQADVAMTNKLQTALQETVKQFRNSLPPDIKKDASKRIADALQRTTTFNPETADNILGTVLGGLDFDPAITKHFRRRLAAHDIDEEGFKIVKGAIARPKSRRIETVEGIRIVYDDAFSELIKISRAKSGTGAEIVIKTQRIETEDYDTESNIRRSR
jgi:hypothetical protein